jgi:tRNA/tmRNA/rRNA uracil-C5-methylase (TrmA/RlmC/RlmD family)
MGKFDKYTNRKMKFSIDGEDLEIEFKVRDRIELAAIHECKNQSEQYDKLITFCGKLMARSYPTEPPESFDGFLVRNLETFLEEVMIGANLATKEQFTKQKEVHGGDFRKEGNQGGVQKEAHAK